jgi:hypothetical protein
MIMKFGMDLYQAAPEAIKALSALETLLQDNGLEQSLIELVKTVPHRSTVAEFTQKGTLRMRANTAKPGSGCTRSMPGVRLLSTQTASAARSPGPRP